MPSNAKNLSELLNTDSTVAVGDIADGSVTTAKLADNAVTNAKLSSTAVTSAKMASLSTIHILASYGSTVDKSIFTTGS